MSSLSGQVAAAVVSALSSGGFQNVELSYCPSSILADNPDYKIYVTPTAYRHSLDLNRVAKVVSVSVVIVTSISDPLEFEYHNETIEKIADLFFKKQIAGLNAASCNRFEVNPLGSEQRYREHGQYLAAIELDFLIL
jgi:hypothetical protein